MGEPTNALLDPRRFEAYKDRIVDACTNGLSADRAAALVHCPVEYFEALKEDQDFQERLDYVYAQLEFALLEAQSLAISRQVAKGISSGAQWKLERLNKSRWGKEDAFGKDGLAPIHFDKEDLGLL